MYGLAVYEVALILEVKILERHSRIIRASTKTAPLFPEKSRFMKLSTNHTRQKLLPLLCNDDDTPPIYSLDQFVMIF